MKFQEFKTMNLSLSDLKPKLGSKHKPKRIGCGEGSGHGGSGSTRGMKGQRARSGEGKNPGFEGGQMPLLRRIPKRGFTNKKFKNEFQEVTIDKIFEKIPKEIKEVTIDVLKQYNLIKSLNLPVKILLGKKQTSFDRKLKLYAHKFTKSVEKILKEKGVEYVRFNY